MPDISQVVNTELKVKQKTRRVVEEEKELTYHTVEVVEVPSFNKVPILLVPIEAPAMVDDEVVEKVAERFTKLFWSELNGKVYHRVVDLLNYKNENRWRE